MNKLPASPRSNSIDMDDSDSPVCMHFSKAFLGRKSAGAAGAGIFHARPRRPPSGSWQLIAGVQYPQPAEQGTRRTIPDHRCRQFYQFVAEFGV